MKYIRRARAVGFMYPPHQIRRLSVVQSSKLIKLAIWPLVNFFKNTWSILVMSNEVPTKTYCLRFLLPCPLFLAFAPL